MKKYIAEYYKNDNDSFQNSFLKNNVLSLMTDYGLKDIFIGTYVILILKGPSDDIITIVEGEITNFEIFEEDGALGIEIDNDSYFDLISINDIIIN